MGRKLAALSALAVLVALSVPAGATFGFSATGVGRYDGEGEGAAEISAFDPWTDRLFVTNVADDLNTLDVLEVATDGSLTKIDSIDMSPYGAGINSVAVYRGLVAAAVEADATMDPGVVVLIDARTLSVVDTVTVGVLPDMVTFSRNGRYIVTANEAEPNDDYTEDPEGSVSVITLAGRRVRSVRTAGFGAFDSKRDELIAAGVRIFGPGATVSQDLEPEYVAISDNSRTAYVTLQENNALAIVDLRRARVTDVVPLGYKDHSADGNGLDASNEDSVDGNILNWPTLGMYQPDAIDYHRGFLFTANEGDARDYDGFSEEERVDDLVLDPDVFPDMDWLQQDENLGRLKTTTATGDTDGDGDFDEIYSYGARSMSVWDARTGALVWDSGSLVEEAVLAAGTWQEGRSDDKGPEPEGVEIGRIGRRTYAFLGLERTSDIVVFDVTRPTSPRLVDVIPAPDGAVSPDGIQFISRAASPTRTALLVVTYEVSGTTVIYALGG